MTPHLDRELDTKMTQAADTENRDEIVDPVVAPQPLGAGGRNLKEFGWT